MMIEIILMSRLFDLTRKTFYREILSSIAFRSDIEEKVYENMFQNFFEFFDYIFQNLTLTFFKRFLKSFEEIFKILQNSLHKVFKIIGKLPKAYEVSGDVLKSLWEAFEKSLGSF
jgi:hypothetical protein